MFLEFTPSALLIIDVQRAIDDPSWGKRNNPDAEACMSRLLDHWRQQRWPIVHVRHESREAGSTYRAGQIGCEFKEQVQPILGETIITKNTNNAFIGTDLHALLKAKNIGSLVICGVITNNSVEATVRMAGNLGYLTYLVSDACATFDKVDYQGIYRTADAVHAMSLANIDGEYAKVLTVSQVLEGLLTRSAVESCTSLEEVRYKIDRIDRELVALLADRGRYVKEASRFKKNEIAVRAADRVEQVISKVRSTAEQLGADPSITEQVYRTMIGAFIEAEMKAWGDEGSR
jgi:nicotinamidase-related amidase/chorismate mutase